MPAPIAVDIWSDVACPWCYIGKRRFEAGAAAFATEDEHTPRVEVTFRSYELLPDMPTDFDGGATDFLVRAKGLAAEHVRRMHGQVTAVAAEVGLAYDFAKQQPTNTRKAHQVLHLARVHGIQKVVKERLLAAHFVEGRHVGRDEDLADLAAEVGLDRGEVLAALSEETYLPAVRADIDQARALGVDGVPFFVLDGRYALSGAQPAETFTRALAQVQRERRESEVA